MSIIDAMYPKRASTIVEPDSNHYDDFYSLFDTAIIGTVRATQGARLAAHLGVGRVGIGSEYVISEVEPRLDQDYFSKKFEVKRSSDFEVLATFQGFQAKFLGEQISVDRTDGDEMWLARGGTILFEWEREGEQIVANFYAVLMELIGMESQSSQQMIQAAKTVKRVGTRQPSEPDRIRTTLATWAVSTGKCRSYADACTQLGIDPDTRRNHEKNGWLLSIDEVVKMGGYEELWRIYTTQYRKS